MRTPYSHEVETFMRALQDRITAGLEAADGRGRFREDPWERPGGGGGRARVIEEGRVFEKGGVNFSAVEGELPPEFARRVGGEGTQFFATGVSLVLHPRNPHCPTVHANFRYFEQGAARWWGGGADLTPSYLYVSDAAHFHRTLQAACDRHDRAYYPCFKAACDQYFFLKHRGETRGLGGIFFDHLGRGEADPTRHFPLVRDTAHAFLPAYLPIVERRASLCYGARERRHQLWRRGRYAEFNLLYDRGTVFGLETQGRVESILMSLPPLCRWGYNESPAPGTPEARLVEHLRACDWASRD
ncbi:MAG: oxygen-dependent coproporphyrinogen oxidase [Deltaproteobacteria bacterium]|nr:oxygen-dependent coproporphyrinogen oxidase [Deltaproteobacteria bacterium]